MLSLPEIQCPIRICSWPLDYVVGVARRGLVTSLALFKGKRSIDEFCALPDFEC